MSFTEANYENAVLEVFCETLGYGYTYGPDVQRDYTEPLYLDELMPALQRINPSLPEAAINESILKLRSLDSGTLVQKTGSLPILCKMESQLTIITTASNWRDWFI